MVLESVESDLKSTVIRGDGVGIIPLYRLVSATTEKPRGRTHLQILRYTVPDIHTFPIWIITWIEGSARGVKLVGKLKQSVSRYKLYNL